MAGAVLYAATCWGSSSRAGIRPDRVIRKAGAVLGVVLDPVESVEEGRTINKLLSVSIDSTIF